uniref:Uncharacterized protein n=1 Tax=Leersia perrieri TaxID=77586 RepID=A0A0D9VEX3_9ORYZ
MSCSTLGAGATAAAPTGPSFGRGSLGRGVGLPPPPYFSRRVGGSVAAATTLPAFSIGACQRLNLGLMRPAVIPLLLDHGLFRNH